MAGSPSMDDCIRNCTDCHTICLETVAHCLTKGGAHAEAGHIRLLLDCVDICRTSADFMMRGPRSHHRTCGAWADIGPAGADDCDRMADDSMMKRCAEMCRRCAESCRSMSRMAA